MFCEAFAHAAALEPRGVAMAMALPLMTMGLRTVLCMRACARLYCASAGGFVGGRSRRALPRGRAFARGAVLWARLFGRRLVAPGSVLGFRRHCHFRTRAIAYSLALSLSKKRNRMSQRQFIHRIMFVCHGNICRSTMAEFVMRDEQAFCI